MYKYKLVSLLVLLAFGVQAQKFDKKLTESFKVNSNVELVVNANHTDVVIETWNKNTISIEAVMEVEGASKEEAAEILEKWNFEALGNKNKVNVTSISENMNFTFDFPEMNIEIPHFEIPEIEFAEIDFPEMEMPELEDMEFDYETYKKDSTYLKNYKLKVAKQVEKFKNSGWKHKIDSIRNSDEFQKNIAELKRASNEIAIEVNELKKSKEFKFAIEESKRAAAEIRKEMLKNKELWKEHVEQAKEAGKMAREMILKMKKEGKFDSIQNYSENIYFNSVDSKNSKIKIKKYLKIKVPKKATFNLNVKHGKLTVPNSNTKISANVSYGNFIGGVIEGEKNELKISNSPVSMGLINSGNVTLKNVPNATFGTFSNANLFANSSDVLIEKIGKNVALSQKFGELEVLEIHPEFKNINIVLDYAKGIFNFGDASYSYQINGKKSKIYLMNILNKADGIGTDEVEVIQGFFNDKNSSNKLFLTSVYSSAKVN